MKLLKTGWLRAARRKKHLKLKQVAKILNKNKSTICRYENNDLNMSVGILLKLLDIYNIKLNDVVYEYNYENSEVKNYDKV